MNQMKMNLKKTNSCYRYGCYHVGRSDMWGNYCPETGEYYLACFDGECVEVLASAWYDGEYEWNDESAAGYSYEVVRELLQLGHLTKRTLATFLEDWGEVWWDQPNF